MAKRHSKKKNKKRPGARPSIAARQEREATGTTHEVAPIRIFVLEQPFQRTRKFSFWDGFFAPFSASFRALSRSKREVPLPDATEAFLALTSDRLSVGQDVTNSLRKAFVKYAGAFPVIRRGADAAEAAQQPY